MAETKNISRILQLTAISLGLALVVSYQNTSHQPFVSAAGGDCTDAQAQDLTGTENLVTYNAPSGNTITQVCVKSSTTHFKFSSNSSDGCYTVSGIGTGSATVERTGSPSSSCQEISHVDVYYNTSSPTPTPTATPEESSTPSPTPEIAGASATPSPTPEESASPTPTPTTSSTSSSSSSSSDNSSSGGVAGASAASTPTPGPVAAVLGAVAKRLPETGIGALGAVAALASLAGGSGLIYWKYYRNRIRK
ncbi:hypothetical protein HYW43_04730 [Candidatus Daviesbacteria bacterium]|nr:hypothetical protein [Candidatus Daviesbacteria bacterium]